MDHVIWSRRFHELPDAVLQADIDESYGHFVRNFGRPDGFTSPGFYSDARVMRMIGQMGFTYDGDAIGSPARGRCRFWNTMAPGRRRSARCWRSWTSIWRDGVW